MKKIYTSTAAVFIAAVAYATQSLAAAPSITVKSDKSDVTYTYTSSSGSAEASADASKLFDSFNDATVEDYVSANLTITSESNDSDNVEVALRFSTDKTDMEYSVLDYYDFRITDENGDVIYDSDNTDPTAPDASEKDVSFGIFNTESASDTKKFTVEYKIDETSSDNIDDKALDTLTVNVISQAVSDSDTEADYSVTITAETPEIPEIVEAATDKDEPNETPDGDGKKDEDSDVKEIEYQATCGKDLSPGRYTVTGKGIVKIEDSEGKEKSKTTIKDSTVSADIEGVPMSLVVLAEGDVITVEPLPGDEKPSIKFEKTNTGVAPASASSRPTPANDDRSTQVPQSSAANQRAATPEPRKSNPRTGDDSVQTAVISSMMLTAAAAIGILEVIKRKKINN